jgi:hypothetical protein
MKAQLHVLAEQVSVDSVSLLINLVDSDTVRMRSFPNTPEYLRNTIDCFFEILDLADFP